MVEPHPDLDFAAAEPELQDHEFGFQPNGAPTLATLSNAIQCWALLQPSDQVTIAAAALAFHLPPGRVREAVDWHYWMFADGDGPDATIKHEGE